MASQEPQRDESELAEPARRRLHLREVRSDNDDYDGIGAELRAARVRAGIDLADVAQKLRISHGYLEALEQGRFDELPGDVYVFGFLRTYSRFLELDENVAIERYRTEAAGPRRDARLEFPSAMDRGRMPTGRLLLGGLVVAVLAYAAWFVLTSEERSTAERVAPVPERLAAADGAAPASAAPRDDVASPTVVPQDQQLIPPTTEVIDEPSGQTLPSTVAAASTEVAVATTESSDAVAETTTAPIGVTEAPIATTPTSATPEATATAAVEEPVGQLTRSEPTSASLTDEAPLARVEEAAAAATEEEEVSAAVPQVVRRAPGQVQSSPLSEPAGESVTRAAALSPSVNPSAEDNATQVAQIAEASSAPPPAPAVASPEAAVSEAVPQVRAEEPTQVAVATPAEAPPPLATRTDESDAAATGGYVPRVFGAGNEDARIVLVAEGDSWVQVRAGTGELLLTRVLRPGDRYLVPDRPGLVMMTGNVGALRVEVDGQAVPPLGPPGVIGRDIPLDTERLRSGRIYVNEGVSP